MSIGAGTHGPGGASGLVARSMTTRAPAYWATPTGCLPSRGQLLALMPVHDRLGCDDYALLRSAMRLGLATISDRFLLSVDAPQGSCRCVMNVTSMRNESK